LGSWCPLPGLEPRSTVFAGIRLRERSVGISGEFSNVSKKCIKG